jgi:hypothetical protein
MVKNEVGCVMRKTAFSWIPAEIRSYRALYKGRRFWVFENDPARPYGIHTDRLYDQVLVYDSLTETIRANGYWAKDRQIHGCSFWGQGISFASPDAAGMVHQIRAIDKWMDD